jgi:hypothetical protein
VRFRAPSAIDINTHLNEVNQKEYNINYSWFTEKKKKNRQQVARLKN